MKTIVLTGGGSAGHVSLNLALIPELQKDGYVVHYIGTKCGMERKLVESIEGVSYHGIHSGKLRRYFSLQNFLDPFRVILGYFDSKRILSAVQPQAVFSKGGFVTVPVVAAGKKKRIPIILHESDFSPGLANKISTRYADKILVTFEATLRHLPPGKAVLTGTPIRPTLLNGNKSMGLSYLGFDGKKPVLLVTGGSQGAQAINDMLHDSLSDLLDEFDIAHLCGEGKTATAYTDTPGYRQLEYANEELGDIFACSSIALSRAGANSIFEFLALSIPALLIPLPLSQSRGDQIQNAQYFEERGYSLVLQQQELTRESLVQTLKELQRDRQQFVNAMQSSSQNSTTAILREIYAAMESHAKY